MKSRANRKFQKGSIELIVLGLLAALIVVLAIPILGRIGKQSQGVLNNLEQELNNAQNHS